MGIYIKGIEMPKDDEILFIDVYADGKVAHDFDLTCRQIATAVSAADVVERKRGTWIYKRRHRGGFRRVTGIDAYGETHTVTVDERFEIDDPYCPFCGQLNESVFLNFCPNCGADMR